MFCKKCEPCKEIVKVVLLKDIPGAKAGTILEKPTHKNHCGFNDTYMTPECIDHDGSYKPSYSHLHWTEMFILKYPDFFSVEYCEGCSNCCKKK